MIMVRLFGMLKTMVEPGNGMLVLDMPDGSCVNDLIKVLQDRHPQIWELIVKKKVLISVNHEVAQGETPLRETDEIAFLPPFAGGV